jgi:hypothetical protein
MAAWLGRDPLPAEKENLHKIIREAKLKEQLLSVKTILEQMLFYMCLKRQTVPKSHQKQYM